MHMKEIETNMNSFEILFCNWQITVYAPDGNTHANKVYPKTNKFIYNSHMTFRIYIRRTEPGKPLTPPNSHKCQY